MSSRAKAVIDLAATLLYLVAANPSLSGLAVHEWLSLGVVVAFVVHCAVNADAVVGALRRRAASSVLGLVLDVALLLCFMAVTVSGLFVSRHVLPSLGLVAQGYFVWEPLHAVSAKLLLALLVLHVALHARQLLSLLPRRRAGRAGDGGGFKEVGDGDAGDGDVSDAGGEGR
ncbi:MAG: DUF4405 domain-containing protein [Coriobacteriales bacterium]|nr:DUF4405 domain-containing protein [Coriobacteriales bacterium]